MMNGGLMTFMVIEPMFVWELRSELLHAAATGKTAKFVAQPLDDASQSPAEHPFTVKVTGAQFDATPAFDVIDQDGHIIQIKLPEFGPVEFTVYT